MIGDRSEIKMARSGSRFVWAIILVAAMACRSEPEPEPEPEADEEVVEEVSDDEEAEEEITEVFGLPLPPEYHDIRMYEDRVRVATDMSLDELEEFFVRSLADHEVVRPGSRLQVVPLRPNSPRIRAFYFGSSRSHAVVQYRRGTDPDKPPSITGGPPLPDEDEADAAAVERTQRARQREPDPRVMTTTQTPEWIDDVRGEPVELKTADGELLAPGAKWGEPYTPPEGSPLDQERLQHNFGKAFGDWRSP